MTISIENFSFHSVSVSEPAPLLRNITGGGEEDVKNYVEHILKEVTTPPKGQQQIRGQYFHFKSLTERVVKNLIEMSGNLNKTEWGEKSLDNAIKLLDVEKNTQVEIERLKSTIRKGCLLQVKCLMNGSKVIALIKIDDNTFLDEEVMRLKTGLPLDTRMQKVAIITFNQINTITSLLLSDTNATISKYWKLDFLVASVVRDETENTKNAFGEIDKLLKQKIRPISEQDYYFLRNQVILSFRQESFDFSDLVDKVKQYQPINDQLDGQKLVQFIEKLENLPSQGVKGFDTQFDIDVKAINAKLNNTIVIDEFFELKITQNIDDLATKLDVGEDEDGQKFVKIYSDKGYNKFKKNPPSTDTGS
ncbi:nucleoid-associated protein [Acinetobacter terrestris]|uniref:nucleoid-associated protein n=1 Tax=Acinetobacter terrestris TaxID=2529843 RepID=UPI00103B5289|nr:nucleoid-associated protein [Acinetobacter terrestris]TCB62525.1 hypothetical protein E0H81_12150 [Acinetobacter terrestris]